MNTNNRLTQEQQNRLLDDILQSGHLDDDEVVMYAKGEIKDLHQLTEMNKHLSTCKECQDDVELAVAMFTKKKASPKAISSAAKLDDGIKLVGKRLERDIAVKERIDRAMHIIQDLRGVLTCIRLPSFSHRESALVFRGKGDCNSQTPQADSTIDLGDGDSVDVLFLDEGIAILTNPECGIDYALVLGERILLAETIPGANMSIIRCPLEPNSLLTINAYVLPEERLVLFQASLAV